ncbi:MAG: hydrogenase formation protein HypD [Candidatus Omnitrophica bacterium]|nr:hydrogenase formation protein HypD [Candidatus Omnitrophota bacterium]MCM8827459.1 hydrogenase formation protein HypD [Candidatus Omnitrophota bacterium]
MDYIREFRDKKSLGELVKGIKNLSRRRINLMEVCGTHTMAIFKYGLRKLMPDNIKLLSGPGCPVCVTGNEDIDKAIWIAKQKGVILATFGDMLRVPGSTSSIYNEKVNGYDVRFIYSPLDALRLAEDNPKKKIVFFAIGFETTSPAVASSILEAKRRKLNNYFVFCAHKLIPPAMEALLQAKEINIDGFICPGHVSVIIGAKPYEFIAKRYGVPCVITGFEPLDILQGIFMLVRQIESKQASIEIQYRRLVKYEGNLLALKTLEEVFDRTDSYWRGMGVIVDSGLKLRKKYESFDAEGVFKIKQEITKSIPGCLCGEVIRGVKEPIECKYFGKVCTPSSPLGPCMVSIEGACFIYYTYS